MDDIRILHAGDLHYESPNTNYQDDPKYHVDPGLRDNAFRNLHRLLKHCFRTKKLDAAAIVGDVTTHGQDNGFTTFEQKTVPLLTPLLPSPAAICMVPGNHDVKWALDPDLPDYFDQKFSRYVASVNTIGATSSLVPTGPSPKTPNAELSFGTLKSGPLYIDTRKRLLIACLNSSMRCGEINRELKERLASPLPKMVETIRATAEKFARDHNVSHLDAAVRTLEDVNRRMQAHILFDIPHATHPQLDELRGLLAEKRDEMKDGWAGYLKVAVLHHHVTPFDYQMPEHKPFEIMADAASVLDTLGSFGFHIVLTGHKHQPYVQRVRTRNAELLVMGGMTVGGYPVAKFGQGVRHLQVIRRDDHYVARIADLPCDWQGDIVTHVADLIDRAAAEFIIAEPPPRPRYTLPRPIERALDDQLYSRHFYKTDVTFDMTVTETGSGLQFLTTYSYNVVNRSPEKQVWPAKYSLTGRNGKVLDVKINGAPVDLAAREFFDARGLNVPCSVQPDGRCAIWLQVAEEFPAEGSNYFTSYNPATDLHVIVREDLPAVDFDFEILYFWETYPASRVEHQYREVRLTSGLLPYQGVRLNWRRKEKPA